MNDKYKLELDYMIDTAYEYYLDTIQLRAVCRYLRGEVERLERELRLAYKRQAMSNNPFPPILAEEVQARIDELRGELNSPGEVTHE